MGVGKDDGLNPARWNGQLRPVLQPPFLLSLEEAAINQQLEVTAVGFLCRSLLLCAYVDEVFGAGNRTRSAKKLNVAHASPLARSKSIANDPLP
jgi:hypothetical protein